MKKAPSTPYAHLLAAPPHALTAMVEVCREVARRDREEAAERETARVMREAKKVAAQIVRCNDARLGLAPMPTPITALGRQIVSADKRRRGE